MKTKRYFSLQVLGLVTILLIGTVTWTGCQGCEMQPGMSPEGWCCRGDEVFPCPEHECYDTGGDFFPTEHEAVAHCEGQMQGQMPPGEGWCCRNGDVFPCPEHECYDTGGDFFLYEHEAIAHCGGQMPPGEGWCCDGGNVSPCSEDECHSWGGVFFLYEHEAIAHCGGQMPPGEGWCCDAGNVAPCSEAECHGWGGVFFLYEHEAIAHCQGSAPGPSPPGSPVIHYFTANPSTISAGQSSTLKWDVSGATSATLNHGLGNIGAAGNTSVSPTGNTVYTLTATNSAGTVTDTATLTVAGSAPPAGLPVFNYFTANPPSISPGQPVTLSWKVTNVVIPYGILLTAPGFTSAGKALVAVDQLQVFPTSTTTYTLAITNFAAGTSTGTATVTVTGSAPPGGLPVINYFTATPSTISAGQSTTLKWDVSGATQPIELVLGGPPGSVISGLGYQDQYMHSPNANFAYQLKATNATGTALKAVQVTVK